MEEKIKMIGVSADLHDKMKKLQKEIYVITKTKRSLKEMLEDILMYIDGDEYLDLQRQIMLKYVSKYNLDK